MEIKKAERTKSKLKMALWGIPNAGKTYSALLIAKGVGGKIILIDSETGSSSKHVGKVGIPEFYTIDLESTEPEEYIKAIKMAMSADANVIVIDSMTHCWNATKTIAHNVGEQKRNDFAGWGTASPRRQALIDTILKSPVHIISTMRAKTEYTIGQDERTGKMKPIKLGLGPDEKQDAEYEYDLVLSIDQDHKAIVQKDRTDSMANFNGIITEEVGKNLVKWLDEGASNTSIEKPTEERRKYVFVLLGKLGLSYDDAGVKERLKAITKKESMTFWSAEDTEKVIERLEQSVNEKERGKVA